LLAAPSRHVRIDMRVTLGTADEDRQAFSSAERNRIDEQQATPSTAPPSLRPPFLLPNLEARCTLYLLNSAGMPHHRLRWLGLPPRGCHPAPTGRRWCGAANPPSNLPTKQPLLNDQNAHPGVSPNPARGRAPEPLVRCANRRATYLTTRTRLNKLPSTKAEGTPKLLVTALVLVMPVATHKLLPGIASCAPSVIPARSVTWFLLARHSRLRTPRVKPLRRFAVTNAARGSWSHVIGTGKLESPVCPRNIPGSSA